MIKPSTCFGKHSSYMRWLVFQTQQLVRIQAFHHSLEGLDWRNADANERVIEKCVKPPGYLA